MSGRGGLAIQSALSSAQDLPRLARAMMPCKPNAEPLCGGQLIFMAENPD